MLRLGFHIIVIVFFVFTSAVFAKTSHHHKQHKHHPVHHSHHIKHIQHHPEQVAYSATIQSNGFASSTECLDPTLLDAPAAESRHFFSLGKKQLVDLVDKTVSNLHYSTYKLGGKHFDPNKGVYVLDCSGFVDNLLKQTAPSAYSRLVNATGVDTPATQHYYNFFRELSQESDNYWNKINNIDDLRPGDILVFRYRNRHGAETGGHVMVVMNKPMRNEDVFLVRVADSAPSGHSEDTRREGYSGIGIGTLLLKASPRTGQPSAYVWGLGGYWNRNVSIAMARPLEETV